MSCSVEQPAVCRSGAFIGSMVDFVIHRKTEQKIPKGLDKGWTNNHRITREHGRGVLRLANCK